MVAPTFHSEEVPGLGARDLALVPAARALCSELERMGECAGWEELALSDKHAYLRCVQAVIFSLPHDVGEARP